MGCNYKTDKSSVRAPVNYIVKSHHEPRSDLSVCCSNTRTELLHLQEAPLTSTEESALRTCFHFVCTKLPSALEMNQASAVTARAPRVYLSLIPCLQQIVRSE